MDERKINEAPPSNQPPEVTQVQTQPKQNLYEPGPGETGYVPKGVHDRERELSGPQLGGTPSLQPSGTPAINKPSFEEKAGIVAPIKPAVAAQVPAHKPAKSVPARDHLGRLTHDTDGNVIKYEGDTDKIVK